MAKKRISTAQRELREEKRKLTIGGIVLAVGLAAIALIFLLGTPKGAANANGLPITVSVERGHELYQQGAFVLDVREISEWNEFHAPNTTLIPLGELSSRLAEVPKDKPILVVCRSGNRSDTGRDILLQAGYTNVTSMDGGLNAWRSAGYPLEP